MCCGISSIGSGRALGLHSLMASDAAQLREGHVAQKAQSSVAWNGPFLKGLVQRGSMSVMQVDSRHMTHLCRERCQAWWPSSSALCPSRARPPLEPQP